MENGKDKKRLSGNITFSREFVDNYDRVTIEDKKTLYGCDHTWDDLLQEFVQFLRGMGYGIPEGELEFIKSDEVVVKKTEAVLWAKDRRIKNDKLNDDF